MIMKAVGMVLMTAAQCAAQGTGTLHATFGTRNVASGNSTSVTLVLYSDDLQNTFSIFPVPTFIVSGSLSVIVPDEYLALKQFKIMNGGDGWAMDYIELSTPEATARVDTDLWFDSPINENYNYDAPVLESLTWGKLDITAATQDVANGASSTTSLQLYSDDLQTTLDPIPFLSGAQGQSTNSIAYIPVGFFGLNKFTVLNGADGWAVDYIELSSLEATARAEGDFWIDNPVQNDNSFESFTWGKLDITAATQDVASGASSTTSLQLYSDDLQTVLEPIPFLSGARGESTDTVAYIPEGYFALKKFTVLNAADGWAVDYIELSSLEATARAEGYFWIDNPVQDSSDYNGATGFESFTWGELVIIAASRDVASADSDTVSVGLFSNNIQSILPQLVISLPSIARGLATRHEVYVGEEYLGLQKFEVLNDANGWAMNSLELTTPEASVTAQGPIWIDNPVQQQGYDMPPIVTSFTYAAEN